MAQLGQKGRLSPKYKKGKLKKKLIKIKPFSKKMHKDWLLCSESDTHLKFTHQNSLHRIINKLHTHIRTKTVWKQYQHKG